MPTPVSSKALRAGASKAKVAPKNESANNARNATGARTKNADIKDQPSASSTSHRRSKGRRRRSALEDLPDVLRQSFTQRFVPLTRQFVSTQDPWAEVTFGELKTIYTIAFGQRLAAEYPLQDDSSDCHRLVSTNLSVQNVLDEPEGAEESDGSDSDRVVLVLLLLAPARTRLCTHPSH